MPDRLFYENELAATTNSLAKKKKERQQLGSELEVLEANLTGPQDLVRRGLLKKAISVKDSEIDDDEALAKSHRKRLDAFAANEPKAAELRTEITTSWENIRKFTGQLIALQDQIRKTVPEIGRLESQIQTLAGAHTNLIGEKLNAPSAYFMLREIDGLLSTQIRPQGPWTYISKKEVLETVAKKEAKAKVAQAARVKVAIEQAIACEVCLKPATLETEVGNDGEDFPPGSGIWNYSHCFKRYSKMIPETVLNK